MIGNIILDKSNYHISLFEQKTELVNSMLDKTHLPIEKRQKHTLFLLKNTCIKRKR